MENAEEKGADGGMNELTVVVRRVKDGISLEKNYVSLPKDYGKESSMDWWAEREIRLHRWLLWTAAC